MGLSATAKAQTPLQAEFTSVPDAPEIGQQITLTDTTQSTTPITRAWDLDGDGKFNDGEKPIHIATFSTPGPHEVALRVRRTGTSNQESIARKTIVVKEATNPVPTPTETATPTPEPTVIHGPKINLPPVARIAKQCGPLGPTTICLAQYAKIGSAEDLRRLRVQRRRRPDHPLRVGRRRQRRLRDRHRHQPEVHPHVPRRAARHAEAARHRQRRRDQRHRARDHQARGRVPGVRAVPAPLRPAASACASTRSSTASSTAPKFPVSVNGITVVPSTNKPIMVNLLNGGLLKKAEIVSGKATATFPFKSENILLQNGPLRWVAQGQPAPEHPGRSTAASSTACGSPARRRTASTSRAAASPARPPI